MRKSILSLVALTTIIAPVALATAPADAAVAKQHHKKHHAKNTACMTKGEWNRLGEGMTRKQVKNVVGSWGKVTDRSDYSDGTFNIWVDYRECNGSTTFVSFSTEVTYGKWDWDPCKDISYSSGNCIGGSVWNDWDPTGVTYTARADYVGSYYS